MNDLPHSYGVLYVRYLASGFGKKAGAPAIEPAHLLMALCECGDVDLAEALDGISDERKRADLVAEATELRIRFTEAGVDPAALRRRIRSRIGVRGVPDESDDLLHRSPASRVAFERAEVVAAEAGAARATTLHLLRALLEEPVPQWAVPAADLGVPDLLAACFPPEPAAGGPPPEPSRVELEVLTGTTAGQRISSTEPTRWVIGRARDCNLCVPEEKNTLISRHHALVEVDPPQVRIRDLGSRNGTRVNEDELERGSADGDAGERDLVDGDVLQLGRTTLRVHIQGPPHCGGCGSVLPWDVTRVAGEFPQDCPSCRPPEPPAPEPSVPDITLEAPAGPRSPTGGRSRAPSLCLVCARGEAAVPSRAPELCRVCGSDPDWLVREIARRVDAEDEPAGLFGGYTVSRLLGTGGMGRVYLARDEQTATQVGIKIMLPRSDGGAAAALFQREARNGGQLRHPNILRQREHFPWHGVLCLVTDFCENGDVNKVLERSGGRLSARRAVRIAIQALDGLHHAHHAPVLVQDADNRVRETWGIVHRDISPGNLLFAGDGAVKVGDFGLSKAFTHAGLSGKTRTGTVMGKPYYMPRRQLLDYRNAGPEVDVWAVAACLYFMLTGEAPRDFDDAAELFGVVLERSPVPIRHREPSVPAAVARVVDDVLAGDTEPVYWTAAALREALARALDD